LVGGRTQLREVACALVLDHLIVESDGGTVQFPYMDFCVICCGGEHVGRGVPRQVIHWAVVVKIKKWVARHFQVKDQHLLRAVGHHCNLVDVDFAPVDLGDGSSIRGLEKELALGHVVVVEDSHLTVLSTNSHHRQAIVLKSEVVDPGIGRVG
jgi:hypothetical protein